jgi:dihydrolipoamide dehydrogenase
MYELAVIGAGSGGYNAALYAASLGLKTVLIERGEIGGTCLNLGCIPTKSLLKSAQVYQSAKTCETFGIVCENVNIDYEKMYLRKDKVIDKLKKGIEYLINKSSLDFVKGQAEFLDKNTLKVDDAIIKAENILIATGSYPAPLPVKGAEYATNSDEVLTKCVTENDIVIIGGGVIGVEFASLFASLGKNVTIIEYASHILPNFDIDAVNTLTMSLKKMGVKIITNAKVFEIEKGDNIKVFAKVNDKEKEFPCQKVIVCIGRKANIESLRLENANILYDKYIFTDNLCQTNVPNIYCAGDAAGKIQLAHFAEAQGLFVVDLIAKRKPCMNLDVVPSVVFSSPEVAFVGKTSSENEKLFSSKVFMTASGKANIENSTGGFVKTVFDPNGVIVGAVIVNSRASELIGELSLAISSHLTVDDIIKTIHPHPTLSETIRLCVIGAKKQIMGD